MRVGAARRVRPRTAGTERPRAARAHAEDAAASPRHGPQHGEAKPPARAGAKPSGAV